MATIRNPAWEIIGSKGRWQSLPLEPYTDGEQRQWPARPYRPSSNERYLIGLAKAWSEKLGVQQPGEKGSLASSRQTHFPRLS